MTLYEKRRTVAKKKQRENLVQFKEQARLSKSLVTIDTDAPVLFHLKSLNLNILIQISFFTYLKSWNLDSSLETFSVSDDLSHKRYTSCFGYRCLVQVGQTLESSSVFAIDTETTSKNPMDARLVGIVIFCETG